MMSLATVVDRVDCVVAAWVDTRTGTVLDQRAPRSEAFIAQALDAVIEMMRSPERPPRMVLLSPRHIHIVQRAANDPYRVLVVICERSPNLGIAVSLVRGLMDAEAA